MVFAGSTIHHLCELFIYLYELNVSTIQGRLWLSGVTSKVLASVTTGILRPGSCHTTLVSKHLKSQCHTRDEKRVDYNKGLAFLDIYVKRDDTW